MTEKRIGRNGLAAVGWLHYFSCVDFPPKIAAVIPCHNEAATVFALVEAVKHWVSTVIVIDDGSTDETSALAEKAGAILLRHSVALGKGAALKAGWKKAQDLKFDWVITLDGDGQHAP